MREQEHLHRRHRGGQREATNPERNVLDVSRRLPLIDQILAAEPSVVRAVEETLAWAEHEGELD
jgi:hypothetical protein